MLIWQGLIRRVKQFISNDFKTIHSIQSLWLCNCWFVWFSTRKYRLAARFALTFRYSLQYRRAIMPTETICWIVFFFLSFTSRMVLSKMWKAATETASKQLRFLNALKFLKFFCLSDGRFISERLITKLVIRYFFSIEICIKVIRLFNNHID